MTVRKPQPHAQRPSDKAAWNAIHQEAARRKLRHALTVCRRAGLMVVVDSDASATWLIPAGEFQDALGRQGLGPNITVIESDPKIWSR